jgi:hypothetical protein
VCPGPRFEFTQGTFSPTQSLAFVTDSRNSKEKYRTLERDSSPEYSDDKDGHLATAAKVTSNSQVM